MHPPPQAKPARSFGKTSDNDGPLGNIGYLPRVATVYDALLQKKVMRDVEQTLSDDFNQDEFEKGINGQTVYKTTASVSCLDLMNVADSIVSPSQTAADELLVHLF